MFNGNQLLSQSRRESLMRLGSGIGLSGLTLAEGATTVTAGEGGAGTMDSLLPKMSHFAPKARRIIQLFMPGGPSQVDTFD